MIDGTLVVFGSIFGFAAYVYYLKTLRDWQRQQADLARLAMEKGQSIPQQMFEVPKMKNNRRSLRWGTILTAIGVALEIAAVEVYYLFDSKYGTKSLVVWGSAFMLVGIALIVLFYIEHNMDNKEDVKDADKQAQ